MSEEKDERERKMAEGLAKINMIGEVMAASRIILRTSLGMNPISFREKIRGFPVHNNTPTVEPLDTSNVDMNNLTQRDVEALIRQAAEKLNRNTGNDNQNTPLFSRKPLLDFLNARDKSALRNKGYNEDDDSAKQRAKAKALAKKKKREGRERADENISMII